MPRVDFVTRKWPPAMGGMETYSFELVKALAPHANVSVIALPGQPDGGVPGAGTLLWFGVRTAVRLLFSRDPAPVVHIGDMALWPMAVLARLRRPGVRQLVSAHGTDVSYSLRGGLRARLYKAYLTMGARLLPRATILANSTATAEHTRSYGFQTVSVVPLAAEVTVTGTPAPAETTVLFSGRLIPLKGCRWFIENVLPLLPDGLTLDVAGTVWDAQERAALDTPRVTYLGRLDQDALWRRQRDALCVVVPNLADKAQYFEGFGLVAVEAAAAGGVVVAARMGGIPDAVQDSETGFLLPPGEAQAWATKIQEIAQWSETTRAAFVARSRAICADHYSWARVARDTAAHYTGSSNAN